MRTTIRFIADNGAKKSNARYYKIHNLVTGEINEKQSRDNLQDDGEVLGVLLEFLEMGWDISKWM